MPPKPPPQLRPFITAASFVAGGLVAINLVSSAVVGALRRASELKRRSVAVPCGVCRGKGFFVCKLCKGNSTIHWSPLFEPVAINPCLCPTCDGNRVQRCLNCLGKRYD